MRCSERSSADRRVHNGGRTHAVRTKRVREGKNGVTKGFDALDLLSPIVKAAFRSVSFDRENFSQHRRIGIN